MQTTAVPELVLFVAPPAPAPGGGARGRRVRRALWGVAPIAADPDLWKDDAGRRRLRRAATVTGVMGLAWASTTTVATVPRSAREDSPAAAAVAADHAAPLAVSFERYLHGDEGGGAPTREPVEAAEADDAAIAPAPASRAADQRADTAAHRGADATARRQGETPDERRAEAARRPRVEAKQRRTEAARNRKAEAAKQRRAEAARQRKIEAAKQRKAEAAEQARQAWRGHVLAFHEEVAITQLSPHVVLVGFHEAAYPGARDVGLTAAPDQHLGQRHVAHTDLTDPLATMVLPGRGRVTGSATAIDVAIPAGRRVFAPVSGTVTTVEPYLLYGRYPDTRIVITPDGRPDLKLVVLHVTGHDVAVGDRVEAGRTVLAASATPFPFESQIDRFTQAEIGRATPHVHLELRPAG